MARQTRVQGYHKRRQKPRRSNGTPGLDLRLVLLDCFLQSDDDPLQTDELSSAAPAPPLFCDSHFLGQGQHHRADQAPQLRVLVCPPLPGPLRDIERKRAQRDGRALEVVDDAAVKPGPQECEREGDGAG
ncbi:hypothetical protein H0H87_001642, partial [Tephrocybe sp. NHM501043]